MATITVSDNVLGQALACTATDTGGISPTTGKAILLQRALIPEGSLMHGRNYLESNGHYSQLSAAAFQRRKKGSTILPQAKKC
jgi:hypothetical protein